MRMSEHKWTKINKIQQRKILPFGKQKRFSTTRRTTDEQWR